jgi:hypothetical protein
VPLAQYNVPSPTPEILNESSKDACALKEENNKELVEDKTNVNAIIKNLFLNI